MYQEKGGRFIPPVLLDRAHTLQKSLSDGEFPARRELLEMLQKLRYSSMSPNLGGAYDVSRTVDHFYEAVCWNDRLKLDLTDTYQDIAYYLVNQTPAILAILPAGQIGTNVYDPTARRFLNVMSLMEKGITEERAENRDLPDFDFIGIFRLPPEMTWRLEPTAWENQRRFFEDALFSSPEWQDIASKLPFAFSNRTFPVSTVVPGPHSDKAYRLRAFHEQLALPVSFTVHIPDVLWQKLDLLIHDNDWQRLDAIRDLLIGIEEPLAIKSAAEIRPDVSGAFRLNYLLCWLSRVEQADIGDLIRHIYSVVEISMPNKVPHKVAAGLQDYSRILWSHTIDIAKASSLIQIMEIDRLRLTEKGKHESDRILEKRKEFLDKKVLVGQ